MPQETISIIVKPHIEPATGNKGVKVCRNLFQAYLGDRLLCISREPLFDAARVLEAEGANLRASQKCIMLDNQLGH